MVVLSLVLITGIFYALAGLYVILLSAWGVFGHMLGLKRCEASNIVLQVCTREAPLLHNAKVIQITESVCQVLKSQTTASKHQHV